MYSSGGAIATGQSLTLTTDGLEATLTLATSLGSWNGNSLLQLTYYDGTADPVLIDSDGNTLYLYCDNTAEGNLEKDY